jgi:serine/threonine protein kinase
LTLLPANTRDDASRSAAIIDEGRVLARVHHPNVVTIFGADCIDERIGLWMELVKGRTLQQAVEDGQTFGASDVVRIGIELCRAVAAVHEASLLHRDIKPHNVMLADIGRVVLMTSARVRSSARGHPQS